MVDFAWDDPIVEKVCLQFDAVIHSVEESNTPIMRKECKTNCFVWMTLGQLLQGDREV